MERMSNCAKCDGTAILLNPMFRARALGIKIRCSILMCDNFINNSLERDRGRVIRTWNSMQFKIRDVRRRKENDNSK